MREKVGKSRNTMFFQWFGVPEAKAAGAEPAGQMRDEKLHAVVARSTCPSQNVQSTPLSDHFWKLRCRKSNRCGAKHISKSKCKKKNTKGSDHFWKLLCRKSARCCGAKHMSKSKCTKHTILGPLLEVEMLKKCTLLWREAHFQVKMYKTHHVRTIFGSSDVEKVHAVVARSTFPSQNVQNTPFSDHFLEVQMSKKCTPLWREAHFEVKMLKKKKHQGFGPLLEVAMSKKCTVLWREAHFQVKMYKTHHSRTIFGGSDVEKVHAVVARSTYPSQNVQSTPWTDHFWRFRCSFAWQAQRIVDLVKSERNVRVL